MVLLTAGNRRAIPSTWRSPITWAGGGNVPPNRLAVMPTLPPSAHVIAPVEVGGMACLSASSFVSAALVRSGCPGDLPQRRALHLIVWPIYPRKRNSEPHAWPASACHDALACSSSRLGSVLGRRMGLRRR